MASPTERHEDKIVGGRRAPAPTVDSPPGVYLPTRSGPLAAADLWRDRIEAAVSGFLLGGGILLVVYTVFVRYVSAAHAPVYTDELTVYIVMWAVLVGCGGITHKRLHVRADLVLHVMSDRVRFICEVAANFAGFAFALFLGWYGFLVAYEAWDFGDLSPTNLRFPLWIYYAALPVAAFLMAVGHLRVAIALLLTGPRPEPVAHASEV